jgi:hypothetical protein
MAPDLRGERRVSVSQHLPNVRVEGLMISGDPATSVCEASRYGASNEERSS